MRNVNIHLRRAQLEITAPLNIPRQAQSRGAAVVLGHDAF